MASFTQIFVMANRVFGWAAVVAGALILAEGTFRGIVGRPDGFSTPWRLLIGAIFLLIGVLYIRAPLTRRNARGRSNSSTAE